MDTADVETVVSPDWVESRLPSFARDDHEYQLIEVDAYPDTYTDGHIPGAVTVDWQSDLRDTAVFDVPSTDAFERLLGSLGVTRDSTVVLYGDTQNWFAAYAYWLLAYYGHPNIRMLDGGRDYWAATGRELTQATPAVPSRDYTVDDRSPSIRVDREGVLSAMDDTTRLVDVRAPAEFRGEILSPPGWNEAVQRGGHIPGAVNIPWSRVVQANGRFRSLADIEAVFADHGISRDDDIIVYCRIGERSALTWVALHELLEFGSVRHYYGSWVEWGNTVGAPVERGREAEP